VLRTVAQGAWGWFTLAASLPWMIRVSYALSVLVILTWVFRKLFPGKRT
jgi:hypothetical protein